MIEKLEVLEYFEIDIYDIKCQLNQVQDDINYKYFPNLQDGICEKCDQKCNRCVKKYDYCIDCKEKYYFKYEIVNQEQNQSCHITCPNNFYNFEENNTKKCIKYQLEFRYFVDDEKKFLDQIKQDIEYSLQAELLEIKFKPNTKISKSTGEKIKKYMENPQYFPNLKILRIIMSNNNINTVNIISQGIATQNNLKIIYIDLTQNKIKDFQPIFQAISKITTLEEINLYLKQIEDIQFEKERTIQQLEKMLQNKTKLSIFNIDLFSIKKCNIVQSDGYYYPNFKNQSCDKCDINCQKCINLKQCINCNSKKLDRYLYNQKCVDKCPQGMLENFFSNRCEKIVNDVYLEFADYDQFQRFYQFIENDMFYIPKIQEIKSINLQFHFGSDSMDEKQIKCFKEEQFLTLFKAFQLAKYENLVQFIVQFNNLVIKDSFKSIVNALERQTSLQILELQFVNCQIIQEQFELLFQSLVKLQNLESLTLKFNENKLQTGKNILVFDSYFSKTNTLKYVSYDIYDINCSVENEGKYYVPNVGLKKCQKCEKPCARCAYTGNKIGEKICTSCSQTMFMDLEKNICTNNCPDGFIGNDKGLCVQDYDDQILVILLISGGVLIIIIIVFLVLYLNYKKQKVKKQIQSQEINDKLSELQAKLIESEQNNSTNSQNSLSQYRYFTPSSGNTMQKKLKEEFMMDTNSLEQLEKQQKQQQSIDSHNIFQSKQFQPFIDISISQNTSTLKKKDVTTNSKQSQNYNIQSNFELTSVQSSLSIKQIQQQKLNQQLQDKKNSINTNSDNNSSNKNINNYKGGVSLIQEENNQGSQNENEEILKVNQNQMQDKDINQKKTNINQKFYTPQKQSQNNEGYGNENYNNFNNNNNNIFSSLYSRKIGDIQTQNQLKSDLKDTQVFLDLDQFQSRYQIIQELGQGSYGKVYKYFDKINKQKVAIKEIEFNKEYSEIIIQEAYKEIQNLKDINKCENIVQFYRYHITEVQKIQVRSKKNTESSQYSDDSDSEENYKSYKLLLVMELGQYSLDKLIQKKKKLKQKFTQQEILKIIKDLIKACTNLKQCLNIAHRDIKPKNILQINGNWKLCDFGSAKMLESNVLNQSLTSKHTMIGTVIYLSPEQKTNYLLNALQRKDQEKPLNPFSSDIFSLGITFYEVITLISPQSMNDSPDLLELNLRQNLLQQQNYDPFILKNVYNMLKWDPKQRSSFEDLLQKFNNINIEN